MKNLGAKPIIDIDIEYSNHEDLEMIIKLLEQNNYYYNGTQGIKGRHVFKYETSPFHEHHLYAVHSDSLELQKHLTFRDALRNSIRMRNNYQTIKQNLINKNNNDRELYTNSKTDIVNQIMKESTHMKTIVFAGGCFWGVEAYFKQLEGVVDTEVGYINGDGSTNYKEVCAGSGHAEAVYIEYDNDVISLKKLLDHLFNIIDPTSINKQGPDIGVQYRTGIYNYHLEDIDFIQNYINVRQKEYSKPIALELATNLEFYSAEDYHQDYLEKNKNGYCHVNLDSHKNV